MKKVLSLVLALTMVLGMSTMAFAAGTANINGLNLDHTAAAATTVNPGKTYTFTEYDLANAWDATAGGNNNKVGTLTLDTSAGATTAADRNLVSSASASVKVFNPSAAVGSQYAEITYTITIKSGVTLTTYYPEFYFEDSAGNSALLDLTAGLVIEAASTGGTSGTGIPSGAKIDGIADDWIEYLTWGTGDFDPTQVASVTGDMVAKAVLTPNMFTWAGYTTAEVAAWDQTALRSNYLNQSSNKIDVRKTNPTNNGGTIKEVVIDGVTLKVKTVKYFLKCGSTDVSFDLALTHKSSASSTKYRASFTIENSKEYIDEGQTEVDTDDHIYLEADASVRNLEMYIGENLYITKSFGKGQKAYARVDLELSAGDEALFQKYPELSDVYTLYTVGVSSAGVTAKFDIPDTLFVYDENYKLVGTTADTKLPFSSKYYLTTKKVDLGGSAVEGPAETDESSTTPAETDNAGTGGGTVTAPSNYNPNTGR